MTDLTYARRSNGRFTASVESHERDGQAARLAALGWTYTRIGEHFHVTRQGAWSMVQRAMHEAGKQSREDALAVELAKLDAYEQAALEVLGRAHVTVSQGRVVTINGTPLPDDAPVLAALDRLLKIGDMRAKRLGLDAPSKIEVSDGLDADIARLVEELAGRGETGTESPARV